MFRRGRFAVILATPVFAALLFGPALSAGDKKDKGPEAGKDMVVVGCLAQGDQPDVYQIKTDDKTYVLVGDKAKMAKHVGHTVTLSGHVDTETLRGKKRRPQSREILIVSKSAVGRRQAALALEKVGRGEWIRTTGLLVPNQALYQAEPRPEWICSLLKTPPQQRV